jgi:hypothetical protein
MSYALLIPVAAVATGVVVIVVAIAVVLVLLFVTLSMRGVSGGAGSAGRSWLRPTSVRRAQSATVTSPKSRLGGTIQTAKSAPAASHESLRHGNGSRERPGSVAAARIGREAYVVEHPCEHTRAWRP